MGSKAGLGYKFGSAVLIFILSYLCAYLPFMIKAFKANRTLVSLANCLAGGIFLSAGLIHILPDALEAWDDGNEDDGNKVAHGGDDDHAEPFPWVQFTILCSFSTILLIDRVLLPGHHNHGHAEEEDDHGHGTHTAGIIAAGINNGMGMVGICPDCSLLPVKSIYQKLLF